MKLYETERFYLRPFTREDAKGNYRNWWTDQEVTKYSSHGLFPMRSAELEDFLNSLESNSKIVWAVVVKNAFWTESHKKQYKNMGLVMPPSPSDVAFFSDGIHIGNVSLQSIDYINRTGEFAVVIGEKDYWNQGYTTEAARFLFSHAFDKLNLHRIWLGAAATNIGMRKVAEKLHMYEEGRRRKAVFLEGEYQDVIRYGLLREEWNNHEK